MGNGYTRNDTANNIADGNVINASDLDGEFDKLQTAFDGTSGHSHDGTTGEGPQIGTTGIANDAVTGDKLANNIQIAGTLGVTGETTLTTHLNMGDNDIIKLGASADLQIYHDGNNSIIHDNGTGVLKLRATDFRLSNAGNTLDYIACTDGGDVDLSYNGTVRFSTTNTGVSVTGNVVVSGTVDGRDVASDGSKLDGIESGATADQSASEILTLIKTVDGSGSGLDADALDGIGSSSFLRSDAEDTKTAGALNFSDNVLARFGTGNDLQIYHDGSNSYIIDNGTGNLRIRASDFQLQDSAGYSYIEMSDNGTGGTVELKNNASTKLTTKSDGVLITGELEATTLDINGNADISGTLTMGGNIDLQDNDYLLLGTGDDFQIYHDSSNNFITSNGNGDIYIRQNRNDGDIFIQSDDSAGNIANYFQADGSTGEARLFHYGTQKLNTTSGGININGAINAVDDITIAGSVYHEGDTDSYFGFHAANQWRVVTGNTEMLEVNDSYILLGANTRGNVQTANVNGGSTPDFYTYNSFIWTFTGNVTLNNPSTETGGMSGVFIFIQDGTGSRTLSLGTDWETAGGAGITLSTAPNAVDIVPYFVQSSGNILLGTPQLAFS